MQEQFSNIDRLKKIIYSGPEKYNFNASIDIKEIDTIEKAFGLEFPASYKGFLAQFNGGMITEFHGSFYVDMLDWEPDGPKYSSFYFFDIDEVVDKYRDLDLDNYYTKSEIKGIYPFIPICNTPDQNLLFVLSQKYLQFESPVFYGLKADDAFYVKQIANNFNEFLGNYIDNSGFPNIDIDKEDNSFNEFIESYKVITQANEAETNEQKIQRLSSHLTIYPDNSWDYLERGNAYRYDGKRKEALADYNRAIDLNPEESYFYFTRGDLTLKHGSARRALVDLDIAVQIEANDKLYLSSRAEAFLKLNKLELALADCNKILELQWDYYLGLSLRIQVYRALGEHEKADKDNQLFDDLYSIH